MFLRPCSEEGSDAAEPVVNNQINPDCDNSAVDNPQVENYRRAGSWLGRLPLTEMKKIEQVRGLSVPNPYHCATDASSLDGDI